MSQRFKEIVAEKKVRKDREMRLDFDLLCHARQREFVADTSKYIMACCSRRAGKTYGIAIKMLKTGFQHPNTRILYATMSRSMGKDILFPALEELNELYNLGLQFKQNTGDIVLPNKTRILMRGIGSKREVDKLRGPAYVAACIDEGQGMNWLLTYALEEVIEPATLQYGDDAWIAVTGTPNAMCSGPFYDMFSGTARDSDGELKKTYSVHHWTFFDNETIPHPEKTASEIRERKGWTEETPKYQREYLGRWVKDTEGSAFHIRHERDVIYNFPKDDATDWRYTLGVDLGIVDPCAYVLIGWSRQIGQAYVLESFEREVQNTMEAAAEVERLMEQYPKLDIVADSGGIGKAFVADWASISGIPVRAAQKTGKAGRVGLVNSDFQAGKLKIINQHNHDLINQLQILQWDEDDLDRGRHVYARGYRDHLADALQYAFTECHHHHTRFGYNQDESFQARCLREEEVMEKAQLKRLKARKNPGSRARRAWKSFYKASQ